MLKTQVGQWERRETSLRSPTRGAARSSLVGALSPQAPQGSGSRVTTQMYFFLFFADLEDFLLVAMAYDRYVAICFPLHYTTIMSPRLCLFLVVLPWVLSTFYWSGLPFPSPMHACMLSHFSRVRVEKNQEQCWVLFLYSSNQSDLYCQLPLLSGHIFVT